MFYKVLGSWIEKWQIYKGGMPGALLFIKYRSEETFECRGISLAIQFKVKIWLHSPFSKLSEIPLWIIRWICNKGPRNSLNILTAPCHRRPPPPKYTGNSLLRNPLYLYTFDCQITSHITPATVSYRGSSLPLFQNFRTWLLHYETRHQTTAQEPRTETTMVNHTPFSSMWLSIASQHLQWKALVFCQNNCRPISSPPLTACLII